MLMVKVQMLILIMAKYNSVTFILGIHLAMCSIVYEPPREVYDVPEDCSGSENEEEDEEEDSNWTEDTDGSGTPELSSDISVPIKKVTKIVNLFRKSPKLWERLLKRTGDELEDGPLGLLKHSRTRWNGLFFSIKRFCKIR